MILLHSSKTDLSGQKISLELSRRKIDHRWVHTADTLKSTYLTHRIGGESKRTDTLFCQEGERIDLNEISVIFTRRPSNTEFDDKKYDAGLQNWIIRDYLNYFLETLEMLKCEWFPARPSVIYALEDEKLKELYVAQNIGLKVPDTIVTNEPKLILEFYRNHQGRVISKRYNTSRMFYKGLEFGAATSPVSLRDIGFIRHVQNSPTLFQEYIPKAKELRVTVIGDKTVTAEIDSQKSHRTRHDWRNYDTKRTRYKLHKLPDEIHKQLVQLTSRQGLHYSTCDLVITPQGEYIFLEINPAGQYAWIENTIDVDITGLICDKLISLAASGNKPITGHSNSKAAEKQPKSSLVIKDI